MRRTPRPELTRFDPGRFRRIWAVTQTIADEPGHTRGELATRFHLSERQIQADLIIIRDELRLPLVRSAGYRFSAECAPSVAGGLTLVDALTLVLELSSAAGRRSEQGRARIDALADKLPIVFPPHLQPIVGRMLTAVSAPAASPERLFLALAHAVLEGRWVRLHQQFGLEQTPMQEPIVQPELLLPYLGRWYVIARMEGRDDVRERMLCLDGIRAISPAAVAS